MKPRTVPLDFIVIFAPLLVVCLVLSHFIHFKHVKIADKDYVQAIVGEAANQSEATMTCVAHALRNRGNLKGVYGYGAKHVQTESKATWRKAWVAWSISGHEYDITHGSKNWGTLDDLEANDIEKGIKIQCEDLYFY